MGTQCSGNFLESIGIFWKRPLVMGDKESELTVSDNKESLLVVELGDRPATKPSAYNLSCLQDKICDVGAKIIGRAKQ